jgi:hypothetical protein
MADGLPIGAEASTDRLVARLRSALRVRALHATVLRRAETLAEQRGNVPALPAGDPLDDATMLVAGRGRSYPALAVAVGERVGLIGALSVETAARYLNARAVDGLVIGDGFSARVVEALLTALTEDARFRDLPVAVPLSLPGLAEAYGPSLPNLECIEGGPEALLERMLPLVRLHALEARLRRMLASIDAGGVIDPDSGLLTQDAFRHDFAYAVAESQKRAHALSIARFAFAPDSERRTVMDAARLISRIVRSADFASVAPDGSILCTFTETDLRAAHVIARRIASVLKHTVLNADRDRRKTDPALTLATLKPTDTVDTLMARVGGLPTGAAE